MAKVKQKSCWEVGCGHESSKGGTGATERAVWYAWLKKRKTWQNRTGSPGTGQRSKNHVNLLSKGGRTGENDMPKIKEVTAKRGGMMVFPKKRNFGV